MQSLEDQMREVCREVAELNRRLGDRNTALIFDLDARYMPREDLRREYVPRVEHEARSRDRRYQLPLVIFAALTWVSSNVLALLQIVH